MILLVNAANRAAYSDLLDDLFRARHEVFVEFKGWEELRRPDGREIDAFDGDDTAYLIALEDGEVLAGARLTGVGGGTIAETMLPELFDGDPPRGEDILEITRLFARPALTPRGEMGSPLRDMLLAGAEFVRLTDARGALMIVHLHVAQAMLAWGASVEPLGLPRRTRDGTLIAVMSHASPLAGRNLRTAAGMAHPVIHWADAPDEIPRPYAEILGIDPFDNAWTPPGTWTPLERAHLAPRRLAKADA